MVLKEIADTLRFFRNEGYNIYLCLSEEFSEGCRKALSEFSPQQDAKEPLSISPVFYDDMKIAEIGIIGDNEKLEALSTSLKYILFAFYEENRKNVSEANEHDFYRKGLQYIKEHYTENITVVDVAAHIGYSESYFGYAFKKKYKISVSQYVRELQLAKAKDLLEDTSFSVSSVASYVGFDDSNYFSTLFKKHFGLSPKEYRRIKNTLV